MLSAMMPEPGSPDEVNRLWDLMCKGGPPPSTPHRIQFSLACLSRATADFIAQYLEHSAEFTSTPPRPSVSDEGREYWDLEVISREEPLSLPFLQQTCATVRAAAVSFGCRLYTWGSYAEGAA